MLLLSEESQLAKDLARHSHVGQKLCDRAVDSCTRHDALLIGLSPNGQLSPHSKTIPGLNPAVALLFRVEPSAWVHFLQFSPTVQRRVGQATWQIDSKLPVGVNEFVFFACVWAPALEGDVHNMTGKRLIREHMITAIDC